HTGTSTSEVLPTPASPECRTNRPEPAAASAAYSSRVPRKCPRSSNSIAEVLKPVVRGVIPVFLAGLGSDRRTTGDAADRYIAVCSLPYANSAGGYRRLAWCR